MANFAKQKIPWTLYSSALILNHTSLYVKPAQPTVQINYFETWLNLIHPCVTLHTIQPTKTNNNDDNNNIQEKNNCGIIISIGRYPNSAESSQYWKKSGLCISYTLCVSIIN